MNIRKIIGNPQNYWEFCREERNYAAILFAALCKKENLAAFLKKCGIDDDPIENNQFGIYYEYAYLRDLWNGIGKSDEGDKQESSNSLDTIEVANIKRKEIILKFLQNVAGVEAILNKSIIEINQHFVSGKPSEIFIQSPGRWSVATMSNKETFKRPSDLLAACKFKWAFNIKPDLVIHLSKTRAICIEIKHESGEGRYPAATGEKDIFKRAGIEETVGQIEMQKYLMTELLGLTTQFICIKSKINQTGNRPHDCPTELHWKDVFGCMDMTHMPFFAQNMAFKISEKT